MEDGRPQGPDAPAGAETPAASVAPAASAAAPAHAARRPRPARGVRASGRAPWHRIVLGSLPVLLGTLLIGVLSGQVLAHFQGRLLAVPVLLALVPAVNGIGGNVASVLGSRVASGMHFGGLWSNGARGFRRDVAAALLLGACSFAFLGLLAVAGGGLLGIDAPLEPWRLLMTTLLAGTLLVLLMVGLVIVLGILSHRRGWDADNIVVPVLTTAVDALGIVILLLSALVIGL